ncbi:MAG TPA: HipA domain-containing protein [Solirubrobacteraceae bacterium]|jgi:serine/threonine-protein kinase HipA|nr:HipA domain-containing protein [Solirubrobacteraceae bacterium]
MADGPVEVFVEIGGERLLAGRLWAHRRRGAESATFRYEVSYLAQKSAYALDPALPLVEGSQQTPLGRAMFGAFSDCAPDRWGRRLINRAEEHRVREAGTGAERNFGEADYLLRVRDDLRQGALRFRDPHTKDWLATESDGVPHLLELPALLSASERMERDEATAAELRTLLRGGSSLGGTRPKAHVLDANGCVAIAKFPSPVADEWDVMRWEALALRLARRAGVDAARAQLHEVDGRYVLLVDRFDRAGGRRVGYVSALTMLEAADGDQASYVDIAEAVEEHSPAAARDLRELWRRMVFGILIRNTDDHLRNHGFVRADTAGWSLSPAFDVNPDPSPGIARLATSIDGRTDEARVDVALEVADVFRLSDDEARDVLREVGAATAGWRDLAAELSLPAVEIDRMAAAFDHDQATFARRV